MENDQILVAGATGDLGRTITENLLSQGKRVRILVRSKSNYQSLVEEGAEPIFGDLKDPTSLNVACKGIKILITTATATQRSEPDNPITVDLNGNHSLIDAAKACGVEQFIFTSLSIADPNSPIPFVQAKAKTEAYLKSSGMPYTIVAPNAFMETWIALPIGIPAVTTQSVTIVGEGKTRHSFISLFDVAKFIVATINSPIAVNKRVVIGGPEPLSLMDVVKVFEETLNQKINVNHIPLNESVPGLPPLMSQMLASLNFFETPMEMDTLSKQYGVKLTSMKDYVENFVTKKSKEEN